VLEMGRYKTQTYMIVFIYVFFTFSIITPGFQRSVAVSVAKYVRITFFRKNSVRTP